MPNTTPTQKLVHVQLAINIAFDANGEDPKWLRDNAESAVRREFGNGGITGGSDAVVEEYDVDAQLLSSDAFDLDEAELSTWLSDQIEDGHIALGDIPNLMARFALASPAAMRQEMVERMEQGKDDQADQQPAQNLPV